jgi:hypothetical protein
MLIIGAIFMLCGLAMILLDKPKKEVEEEKDIADMTYDEFSLYILHNDIIPYTKRYVPGGEDFEIYHIQGRYFYRGYNVWSDTYKFYELIQIACLTFTDDCQILRDTALPGMFECDCSVEGIDDDGLHYCWFKKVGESDVIQNTI